MPTHPAIAGTCEAVIRLLRANYDPTRFDGAAFHFQVNVADNFQQPMEQNVSPQALLRVLRGAAGLAQP